MTDGAVGGIYEVCIGVPDLTESAMYFERFGYRILQSGSLSAEAAYAMYGVRSALSSMRLAHLEANNGFIRLMRWDEPINSGLGVDSMRAYGSRWSAQHTPSIMSIRQHALLAKEHDITISEHEPTFITMSKAVPGKFAQTVERPFLEPVAQALEYTMLQPYYRQVFFERFGYGDDNYRTYNLSSLFPTTQIMHVALVVQSDDHGVFDFYDKVLGASRGVDLKSNYEDSQASRKVFELREGEDFWHVDFEHPANSELPASQAHPGRLKCFRFSSSSEMPNHLQRSQIGCLGYSAYSWRVGNAKTFINAASNGGAEVVGEVQRDEFGAPAFACKTPDGYSWVFIQG